MARARKSDKSGSGKSKAFSIFDGDENHAEDGQEDLPKDEAGRRKIKRQYEELLGIRIEKLRGRILNRERINKTIEGIYFICASCSSIAVAYHGRAASARRQRPASRGSRASPAPSRGTPA